jgi:hypothetical protein
MPIDGNAAVSWGNNSLKSSRRAVSWIWDGLIADQAITLFSAPEKTGKTTLLSLLLDRRREGGQLLGRGVRAGRTIVCSEEHRELWALRQPPLDFGSQLEFHQPMWSTPTRRGWRRFIDHLLELDHEAFDLLALDSVMHFLPAGQNDPRGMRWAMHELGVVAGRPAGVLLLHQTCAARTRSRARGPLAAAADILIDMHIPSPLAPDRGTGGEGHPSRRRSFAGVGRYPGTLQHVAAELNAEGTDYLLLPDASAEATLAPLLATVRLVLSQSPFPMTRQQILRCWPEADRPPRADSLWRALTRGCDMGLLVRSGAGNKTEAFQYELVRPPAA